MITSLAQCFSSNAVSKSRTSPIECHVDSCIASDDVNKGVEWSMFAPRRSIQGTKEWWIQSFNSD